MKRNDELIKKDIIDQLNWDSRVKTYDIDVEVKDGEVKLMGTVPSYRTREIAGMDALNVSGVKYLNNKLKVMAYPGKILPKDDELKENIEKLISWDQDFDSEDIQISVKNGNITLEGTVDALWKKLKIEEISSNLSGAKQIINMISIVPLETHIDQVISEAVVEALKRNIYVDEKDITVWVENQIVTLSGSVPNWAAYNAARDTAQFTPGVTDVQNNLSLSIPDDTAIQERS
jgi:osmotically-inducible protein OsmY